MPALDPQLRRRLENTVVAARAEAEAGARAALDALAVNSPDAFDHMKAKAEMIGLRKQLRARGKQLGDHLNAKGAEGERTGGTMDHLIHECAYEHWHRMLFARFLAENHLLIDPQARVAVSLEECEELAKEEGANTWELAARFAQAMLPQIFRIDDPLLNVAMPTEHRVALEGMLSDLPAAVFTADDSLGWVYQFWQRDAKDAANEGVKSGAKIDADTLPSVTQLFTEHYMVLFLLHNTIGAWHAGKVLRARAAEAARCQTEADLRRLIALPGYEFEYLRFVKDEATAAWRPAAGTFDAWPKTAKALRVLDPCSGSGHFLVATLELLVNLRMAEERLAPMDAVTAVLSENLFGLELDHRCTQIAAFNVALAAWKLARSRHVGGKPSALPELHIACSGIGPNCTEGQWIKLAEAKLSLSRRSVSPTSPLLPAIGREPLQNGLRNMHALFSKAPDLGSLIDPTELPGDLIAADYETILPFLADVMAEESKGGDAETHERAVAAQGMAKAAEILAGEYTLVITNVPYLGRGGQGEVLKSFAEKHYAEAKADLATVFVARILRWLAKGGTTAVVTPQNWLFLTGYRKLRERLLKERTWNMVARLGPGAFETIGGHVVNVALITLSGDKPLPSTVMAGIDASAAKSTTDKARCLRGEGAGGAGGAGRAGGGGGGGLMSKAPQKLDGPAVEDSLLNGEEGSLPEVSAGPADGTLTLVLQAEQLKNPDAVISVTGHEKGERLIAFADGIQGLATSDNSQFIAQFWEFPKREDDWEWFQMAPERTGLVGGCSQVLHWQDGGGTYMEHALGLKAENRLGGWKSGGEAWGKVGVAVNRVGSLPVTLHRGHLFDCNVAMIVPRDPAHLPAVWAFCQSESYAPAVRKVNAKLAVTNVTLTKVPFDLEHWKHIAAEKYPTGLPEPYCDDPTQWMFHGHPPSAPPAGAPAAVALQVAVARLVGYRWPAELDPPPPPGMPLSAEARAMVERCGALNALADDDGVVPLVPMRGEPAAEGRVRDLLRAAFGGEWSSSKEATLLAAVAAANRGGGGGDKEPAASLDDWLKNRFFAEHCALFHNRPFVWHIWDGRKKDGFGVLVHYHRLAAPNGEGRRLLEKITHGYLGDWIARQRDEVRGNKGGGGGMARMPAWRRRWICSGSLKRSCRVIRRMTSSSAGSRCTSRRSAGSRTSTMACG